MNAHVAGTPDALFFQGIRGQLRQSFSTVLTPTTAIAPFMGVEGSGGTAILSFGDGGNTACVDATITGGFSPTLGHIHFGEAGTNGPVVLDITSLLVAAGRYFGCASVTDLGADDSMVTVRTLADPSQYYFNFHLNGPSDDNDGFFMTVRAQLV